MNLETFKDVATSKFARQLLVAKKHSPVVLFGAGVVGVVGTVVLACRATLKVEETLNKFEFDKEHRIKAAMLDEKAEQQDLNRLKLRTAIDIVKPYLPAVGLGIVSITALTGSHVILTKRNAGVMAAYAAVDRAFKEYRQRVADEYGTETDRKFYRGDEEVAVEEKTADGKTKTLVKKVPGSTGGRSPYAALFDEKSSHFTRSPGMNESVLEMKQSWANDKLKAKGHLFLNEVYDFLDLPRTKEGAVVGWVFDPRNGEHMGDNYVSFGIFDNEPELIEDFFDGNYSGGIWLDFNVDGVIYDKI